MSGRVIRTVGLSAVLLIVSAAPAPGATKPGKATVVDRTGARAGQSVTLLTTPDFKVTGTCEDNGGNDLRANVFLQARRDHLAYTTYGPATGVPKINTDFGPADGKIDFTNNDATGLNPDIEEAEYYEFYAEGRNGRVLRGHEATSVHAKGHDCNFGGTFFQTAQKGPARTLGRVEVKRGKSTTLFANRDLKITGTCTDNGAGDLTASTFLSAKRKHLQYFATGTDVSDTNFGPGDPPVNFIESGHDATGTEPDLQADSYDHDLFTENAKGKVLQARVASGVHVQGADCTYSGVFTGPKSGGELHVVNAIKVRAPMSTTIFQNRDFKVVGVCGVTDPGVSPPGDLTASTFLLARHQNLDYIGYDASPYFDLDFDPADGPALITAENPTGTDPLLRSVDQYTDFWGEGTGGQALNGRVAMGIHVLGADCSFAGIFVG